MTKVLSFFIILVIASCNPYKGFKGVETDEIRGKKPPSQKIQEGHKKAGKKMKKAYEREMKRKARRMGTKKQ